MKNLLSFNYFTQLALYGVLCTVYAAHGVPNNQHMNMQRAEGTHSVVLMALYGSMLYCFSKGVKNVKALNNIQAFSFPSKKLKKWTYNLFNIINKSQRKRILIHIT